MREQRLPVQGEEVKSFSVGRSYPKKFKAFAYALKKEFGASHEFVTWKDDLGLRWVAEARGGGVRMLSNVEFKEINFITDLYEYEVEDEDFKNVITYLWSSMSKKYGTKQIAGLAIMRGLNTFSKAVRWGRKFTNWFRDGDFSLICCELSLNSVRIGKKITLPSNVENYDLDDSRKFHEKWGIIAPEDKIKRINGETL